MSYNGWSNRETWLINVWFNPESVEDVEFAKEQLEEAINNVPDFLKDFINKDVIDWDELKSYFEDDEDEEDEE